MSVKFAKDLIKEINNSDKIPVKNSCVTGEVCDDFMHIENCKEMILDEKVKKRHYELFLELVDIYAYYTQQDHVKYRQLKEKCKSVLKEIME